MERKRFDLRSLSPALRNLWLLLTTYQPRVRSLRENFKLKPSRISIRQGRGFEISRNDRMFEDNKLFII